jgi:hypothetical protein
VSRFELDFHFFAATLALAVLGVTFIVSRAI